MEIASVNFDDEIISPEIILYKALYNKFSQHLRLKHVLLSTRVASICFTEEICQCNPYNTRCTNFNNITERDPKILKTKESFINILKEVRHNLMQEERKRIESEYGDLMNEERNLFLSDLCN